MEELSPRERENIISRLEDMGLTKNEARVYVALVSLGEARASEVAKASGVAREKTYRILRALTSKKYAKEVGGNPKKWRAEEPEKIFLPILLERKKRVEQQEQAINTLEKIFNTAILKNEKQEISIWQVGEGDTEDLIRELMSNGREVIFLLISPYHIDRFSTGVLKDVIKKVHKKDTDIKLVSWMIDGDIFQHAKLDYYTDLSITDTEPLTKSYIVVDWREGLVLDDDGVGIHFTNGRIASMIASLIKSLSEYSTPLKHFIDMYYATNKIPGNAPLTPKYMIETANRLLEGITSEAIQICGYEPIYRATKQVLTQVIPEYQRLTLQEKIKLYKTLLEATYPNMQMDGSIDDKGARITISVEVKYDSEHYRQLKELVRQSRIYPHPYVVGLEGEVREAGYPLAKTLIVDYRRRNILQVMRLYNALKY